METKVKMQSIYAPSDNVVAREIHGEFIIIPIYSGVADAEDELFTLNDTGKDIWKGLDGKKTLKAVVDELSLHYEVDKKEIEKDVLGISEELLKRKMIVKI